jgi:hypothetical protein
MSIGPPKPGMKAEDAMAMVRAMAAQQATGASGSGDEDARTLLPLFAALGGVSLAPPQGSASCRAHLMASSSSQEGGRSVQFGLGGLGATANLDALAASSSRRSGPPPLTTADVPVSEPIPEAQHLPQGQDSGREDRTLDLLSDVMDAWEEAVTRRLHEAVAGAVTLARQDVMQVRAMLPDIVLPDCAASGRAVPGLVQPGACLQQATP